MKNKNLIIKANKIDFYGQTLLTAETNGEIRVAMKPIVEGMGLSWPAQQKKLLRNKIKFSYSHIATTGSDGKIYKMLSIPLKKLPGWFFSVNPNKVRKTIRNIVIQYQNECFDTLYDYWFLGKVDNPRFKNKISHYDSGIKKLSQDDWEDNLFCNWLKVMLDNSDIWEQKINLDIFTFYNNYISFCKKLNKGYKSYNGWARKIRAVFQEHVIRVQKTGKSRRYYRFDDLKACRRQLEEFAGVELWPLGPARLEIN